MVHMEAVPPELAPFDLKVIAFTEINNFPLHLKTREMNWVELFK